MTAQERATRVAQGGTFSHSLTSCARVGIEKQRATPKTWVARVARFSLCTRIRARKEINQQMRHHAPPQATRHQQATP